MKKIIIAVLIVLLIVLAYFTIFNGLSLGNFKILSVGEIKQANDNLTYEIEQTKVLLEKDYPTEKDELSTSITQLLEEKEKYFDMAKISTEGEITKANTEDIYLIEYLWTKVGRHATSKGVNIKMDVVSGDTNESEMKNLNFTVTGQYVGIIDFISSLENDSNLSFKIENFKMIKDEENLTATFVVKNIRIKSEQVANDISTTTTDNTQNTNEEANNNTNEVENSNTTANETTSEGQNSQS